MNIAEIFVNLGIKGSDKTVGSLTDVRKSVKGIESTATSTKVALLGMMWGLEKMMAVSGAAGTGLTNFTALTGKSAKELQQWQYAARQMGVSAEEMTGSVKGVQNAVGNMLMGKGAPEGLALVSKAVGGLDPTKYRDTFYMLTQLQKAMQTMSVEQGNIAGKSFGLSEGTISAMRRNAFNPGALAKAPTYSDRELGSLDKSNIAWSNLGNKIEMAFGHFNAKHGNQIVGDISKIVDQVMKLAEAFEKFSEKIKLLDKVGNIFKGWGMIFDKMTGAVDTLSEKGAWETLKEGASGAGEAVHGLLMTAQGQAETTLGTKGGGGVHGYLQRANDQVKALIKQAAPGVGGANPATVNNNTTINQTITHHGDAKDTHAVKNTHGAAINHAFRQRPAQRRKN